ncbi:MAG: hypothetical protein DRO40_12555 [Thermoprotei archaeon]|nr:MAG: hypothetical protein DRO40_12555 [Thermoprotei archaeon]
MNGVQDRIIVLQGNLYEPVKDVKFDVILSNPPITAGFSIVEKLIKESIKYLKPKGSIQLVVKKGIDRVRRVLMDIYGNIEILASKKGYKVLKSIKQA